MTHSARKVMNCIKHKLLYISAGENDLFIDRPHLATCHNIHRGETKLMFKALSFTYRSRGGKAPGPRLPSSLWTSAKLRKEKNHPDTTYILPPPTHSHSHKHTRSAQGMRAGMSVSVSVWIPMSGGSGLSIRTESRKLLSNNLDFTDVKSENSTDVHSSLCVCRHTWNMYEMKDGWDAFTNPF